MPLDKERSIVADSTASSSPERTPVERDFDASLHIKRPARTYGRRQEMSLVEEPGHLASLFSSTSSRSSTHNTAPPGLLEEVPPSSPHTQFTNPETVHSDDDDEVASSASPKFTFGWKEKLRQLDEDRDADESMNSPTLATNDTVPGGTSFGQPFLLGDLGSGPKIDALTTGTAHNLPSFVSNDLFGGDSLSQEEQSSSRAPHSREAFALSSPKVAPPTRKRLSKIVHDSDSEPEPSKASSSTSPSSSSQLVHNINTPKSRLSTTPPTSDDEMPVKISGKSRSTSKRKSTAQPRPSVPPLDLVEGLLSEPRMRPSSKPTKSKVKAWTKKDQQEMAKERTRMAAGSNASNVIARGTIHKYTKESFFAQLQDPNKQQDSPQPAAVLASDPIEAYSSPPSRSRAPRPGNNLLTSIVARANPLKAQSPPVPNDSDSDEFPEVSDMLKVVEAKNKKEELRKMKQRALEKLQVKSPPNVHNLGDDDDDLEIVSANPKTGVKVEENRRSAKNQYISKTRKHQLQLAHVNLSKLKKSDPTFQLAANKNGGSSTGNPGQFDRFDQIALSKMLATQAMKQAKTVTETKAQEWEKHGGRVVAASVLPAEGLATAMKTIAEQGLKAAEASAANGMDMDDDDDEDDEDWDPKARGSASPHPVEDNDEGSDEEHDENAIEQDVEMADVEEDEAEDGKIHSSRRMVITSDSEGENENDENTPISTILPRAERYRRSISSVDSTAGDEYDKENNNVLMYDEGDDKENAAVVRHNPLERTSRSIFDIMAPPSPDGTSNGWSVRNRTADLDRENGNIAKGRRPFQELLSEEGPSMERQSSNLTQSFAAQLQQASPLSSSLAPAPILNNFKGLSAFSQFSDAGESDSFAAVPLLQPGFSDLFESATEKQRSPTRVNKGSVESIGDDVFSARQLKRVDTLDLTQDVSAVLNLQPAFRVKGDLMRKADAIFEKEQEFVVEAALQKPNKKPEIYVNDHGFLTQTKPIDGTPEVYRPSPSQPMRAGSSHHGPMLSPSEFRSRAPLRTLSISSTQPESPEGKPLRRLKKVGSPTQSVDTALYSPSTTPPPRQNAFDLLARGAANARRRAEAKEAHPGIDISEFLENEAAESDDEDNAFGFVKRKTADDDEDGEDLDQTLTELMDDKEMDESTVAADLVLEKYKEQEQEFDKKVQELHEAVIAGQLRHKRTRGVGVDDSDEESDDDGNERARRAMKKLRTSDRGDIQQLAANEATEAFAAVYNQSFKDDDDFAYLAQETNLDDVIGETHDAEEGDDADDYEDEEEKPETISPQEVMRLARRMKEEGVEEALMDPEDVSWLDKDAEDDAPQVKTVSVRHRPQASQRDVDTLDMDGAMGPPLGKPTERFSTSSKQWYAQENKSRNAGTSRSVGGSAITGHAKVKSKTGAGVGSAEATRAKAGTAPASAGSSRPIKPERSMLSAIADKSRHFA